MANAYTIQEIAAQLSIGESTVKYWRNRYRPWVQESAEEGQKRYSELSYEIFQYIATLTQEGYEPNEIEKMLTQRTSQNLDTGVMQTEAPVHRQPAVGGDSDLLALFQDALKGLTEQQGKIALAQERRAAAEEKKAEALMRRADAEQAKAEALETIAKRFEALDLSQGIGQAGAFNKKQESPLPRNQERIKNELREAEEAEISDDDEIDMSTQELDGLVLGLEDVEHLGEDIHAPEQPSDAVALGTDDFDDLLADIPLTSTSESKSQALDPEIEELMKLVADMPASSQAPDSPSSPDADNFAAVVDEVPDSDLASGPEAIGETFESGGAPALDDLSVLVDEASDVAQPPPLDDLSALVDEPPDPVASLDLDDLSALVGETPEPVSPPDLDDLSALVDATPDSVPAPVLDDLAALVDDSSSAEAAATPRLDDLAALVDETPDSEAVPVLDDLAALVDETPSSGLDDLAMLVEKDDELVELTSASETKVMPDLELDDLAELANVSVGSETAELDELVEIADTPETDQELDELVELVSEKPPSPSNDLDDLTQLIDGKAPSEPTGASQAAPAAIKEASPPPPPPKKKLDLKLPRPEEAEKDPQTYKSKIIASIIQMKEKEGMSIEAVTDYFNDNGVRTLSGKGKWSAKTIGPIFQYIDSRKNQ